MVGNLLTGADSAASPVAIASRAAELGAAVEIVGVVAGDESGDRRLIEIAARGVRHAAVLRSPAAGLEPADLELALRYLPEIRAIVLVDGDGDLIPTAVAAATWSGAGLVVVSSRVDAASLSAGPAIVLEPPAADPDATFAGFVAAIAARLDQGVDAAEAWRDTVGDHAVDRVTGGSRA